MERDPHTVWIVPETLTDQDIAESRQALEELVKVLARATAATCDKLGITFDMDDPEVARKVMTATFDGLFLSAPARPRGGADRT